MIYEHLPKQPPHRFVFLLYLPKCLLRPPFRQVNSPEIVMDGRKRRTQFQRLSECSQCFVELARIIGVSSQVHARGRTERIQFCCSAMESQGLVQSAKAGSEPSG